MPDASFHLSSSGLWRSFGSVEAVRGLDLTIPHGSVYGLLGPNGAGKSTALRLLAGLLRPQRGAMWRNGQPFQPHRPEHRMGLGALIDEPGLWPSLTGRRHLNALPRLGGALDADWRDRVIEELDLPKALDRPVRTWSFGMRQRLGIALALLPQPRLLILDEPTNGLDPRGIYKIRNLLTRLSRETGMTVLISSHLLLEMDALCTHVGILDHGRLAAQGSLAELLGRRRNIVLEVHPLAEARARLETRLRQDDIRTSKDCLHIRVHEDARMEARAVAADLANAGFAISRLEIETPRLEDLFLQVTEEQS